MTMSTTNSGIVLQLIARLLIVERKREEIAFDDTYHGIHQSHDSYLNRKCFDVFIGILMIMYNEIYLLFAKFCSYICLAHTFFLSCSVILGSMCGFELLVLFNSISALLR